MESTPLSVDTVPSPVFIPPLQTADPLRFIRTEIVWRRGAERKELFGGAFFVPGKKKGAAPGQAVVITSKKHAVLIAGSIPRCSLQYIVMSVTKNPSFFTRFAKWASRAVGRPAAFTIAFATLVLWAISGPLFDFSDTWQLIINTGTTIITFLMVFLIQNTQNRDAEAMHVKLDELIRSNKTAHNALLDLEDLEEERAGSNSGRLRAACRAGTRRAETAQTRQAETRKTAEANSGNLTPSGGNFHTFRI